MSRRIARLLGGLALLVAACGARAADVAVLLSEPEGPYAQVAQAIQRHSGASVDTFALAEAETIARARPRLAVAVGTQACRTLAAAPPAAPVLCTLVPRSTFERIAEAPPARGRALSAIVLDQPPARVMALVRAAFPERRHVGALLGPDAAPQAGALAAAAAAQRLRLSSARVAAAEDIHGELQRVLADADVLLAVPDSLVYNPGTAQNILRAAFQSRVPLVGFSAGYARAGAAAAIYSTPAQIGEQSGEWVRAALAGRTQPRLQPPRLFEVAVNRQVARALGLDIDAEATLAERVRRAEETP